MIDLQRIAALQDHATATWHSASASELGGGSPFDDLVLSQHRSNFDLWHEEDAARDPFADNATIAALKRRIDTLNQQRNNLSEAIDQHLLGEAEPQNQAAPLHSETPGLIIDRLSILALKVFHTEEESLRTDAETSHRERAADRLATLRTQQADLQHCLLVLWREIVAGERRFKLYRQFKMYNDPAWNPVLYRAQSGESPPLDESPAAPH